jgi:hypothetical protein
MSNIINRMADTTPKFFKILRNIGVALAAVSAAVFASKVALPPIVTDIAGYLAVAGSQTAVLNLQQNYKDKSPKVIALKSSGEVTEFFK